MRISDWSSDVCSSDLLHVTVKQHQAARMQRTGELLLQQIFGNPALFGGQAVFGAQDAAWADTVAECSRSRPVDGLRHTKRLTRSEEHTSELQSLMRISYAVFCLKKKNNTTNTHDS